MSSGEKVTVASVEQEVARIGTLADSEDAHIAEDAVYVAVLEAIRDGSFSGWDARRIAGAALELLKLDFDRWFS